MTTMHSRDCIMVVARYWTDSCDGCGGCYFLCSLWTFLSAAEEHSSSMEEVVVKMASRNHYWCGLSQTPIVNSKSKMFQLLLSSRKCHGSVMYIGVCQLGPNFGYMLKDTIMGGKWHGTWFISVIFPMVHVCVIRGGCDIFQGFSVNDIIWDLCVRWHLWLWQRWNILRHEPPQTYNRIHDMFDLAQYGPQKGQQLLALHTLKCVCFRRTVV